MKILVTGSSGGIGSAIVNKFTDMGHSVIGLDINPPKFSAKNFMHICADVTGVLPDLPDLDIIINNAGVQNSGRDIAVNLEGAMRVTEKYAFCDGIKSVLFIASASARTGSEFAEYAASKGGLVAYMKNTAMRLSDHSATVNSLSPGGVLTDLNAQVMNDQKKWDRIMSLTPLKKWATPDEIAEWAYFVTVINKSVTAQDILIDNGEADRHEFVW